jgi:hypothetical protein
MDPQQSPLLAQLKDIHGAADPGWWPPAPGWWLLALLLAAVLGFSLRILAVRIAHHRRKRSWIGVLDRLNRRCDPEQQPQAYLAGINRMFRAVALRAFPQAPCARLQGQEWVAFIRSMMPDGTDPDCLRALASGPYEASPQFDAAALRRSARTWVKLYG